MNIDDYRQRIDRLLTQHLPKDSSTLSQAMRYATLQGGKRLRPLLVYAAGLSFSAKLEDLDYPAMAVEIIHAYSLIHDDLPSMDNDLLRRGQPTCHVVFGEAMAILTGDAMQAFAFEILAKCAHPKALTMVLDLAKACGAFGMAGGQAQDLSVVGKVANEIELQAIHRAKTGELIKVSLMLGILAAPEYSAEREAMLEKLGLTLGVAYQIQDDIFDVELATEIRGKQQGADAALNKPTYPAIIGLNNAKKKLQQTIEDIQQQLGQLNTCFSDGDAQGAYLAELIEIILTRNL
jgi:geranylgeranyl pyrophosphate synthase